MKPIVRYTLLVASALLLSACDSDELFINEVVSSPQDVLLDVCFEPDGSAYDKTDSLEILKLSGSHAFTQYNPHFQHYTARFNGTAGNNAAGGGYYKIPYSEAEGFRRGISDGFSIELLFSPYSLANSSLISSFVDSKSEGFGLELDESGEIKFVVATSAGVTTALSRQDTGHAIAAGRYYHVVAVWDYNNEQVRLFIDGSQRQIDPDKHASLPAAGSLVLPASMAKQWLGIGAASVDNDNYAGKTFNGEIVRARVYDKALYADEIKQMYHKSLYAGAPKQLAISKVSFRTPCKVAPGNRYHVYGEGFQSGDSLVFRYPEGEEAFRLETVFNGTDGVSAVLPATLDGGQYQMSVCRDSSEMLLGSVVLTLSDTPDLQVKTGILAHRCVHGNGIPENSLAGLRKTREMGLYGAEFDVWVTTPEEGVDDGVVVVNHDKSYEGKSMEKSTYSQIGHLTLSNGEKLPTLDSFLEEGKDGQVHLTFEIKRHSDPENSRRCADEVLKLIEKHGYTRDMFTITSFDYDNLLYLRSKAGKDKLHLAYHGSKSPDELAADGIDGLAYTMSVFTAHPEWIARAHELGMSTTTWTPSTVEDFTTFIGLEVGSVTVNNVEAAAMYLGRPYLTAE